MVEIRLSESDNTRTVSMGSFRVHFSYGGEDDRPGEDRSFGAWVYWEPSGKLMEEMSFDQPVNRLTSRANGSHGFTGLQYVYAPSGAELQYWCSIE